MFSNFKHSNKLTNDHSNHIIVADNFGRLYFTASLWCVNFHCCRITAAAAKDVHLFYTVGVKCIHIHKPSNNTMPCPQRFSVIDLTSVHLSVDAVYMKHFSVIVQVSFCRRSPPHTSAWSELIATTA